MNDDKIRLMIRDWPPEYQGAVIEFSRHGNITRAAKAVGMARETLSRHMNHGLEGKFTPEDWREVVSLLKWRETVVDGASLAQWLQENVLKKQDWSDLPSTVKIDLIKAMMDFSAEMRRQGSGTMEGHSRSKFTFETDTPASGEQLPEVVQFTKQMLMERFGHARDTGERSVEDSERTDVGGVPDADSTPDDEGSGAAPRSD